jgi:hypothetical protein
MSIDRLKLQDFLDQNDLQKLTTLYSRALDRQDMELMRSLFHPDATIEVGLFSGTLDEFVDHLRETAKIMTYSMLNMTHSTFDVVGPRAAGESYYIGYHLFVGGYGPVSTFFGPTYAEARVADGTIDGLQSYVCGGRYIDIFEKRAGAWKILHRRITNEWNICSPDGTIKDEGMLAKLDLRGSRDLTDRTYVMIAAVESYQEPWL